MRTDGAAAEILAKSAAFQVIVLVSQMSTAGAETMQPSIALSTLRNHGTNTEYAVLISRVSRHPPADFPPGLVASLTTTL